MTKQQQYEQLFKTLDSLCQGETDHTALMATMVCELYHSFKHFNWVGFYRAVGNQTLKIGPYQGAHGCLTISFSRGICGACAREKALQNVPDVSVVTDHIACSSTTKSELVIPILTPEDELLAVLDIDSNTAAVFDEIDEVNLQRIGKYFQENTG